MKSRVLWMGMLLGLSACAVPDFPRRADSRTQMPPPQIFGATVKTLPGRPPADGRDVHGIWSFHRSEHRMEVDTGAEPVFYYAIFLKLTHDYRYELVYQANWGSRDVSSNAMRLLDVREQGEFAISGNTLELKPQSTVSTEKKFGVVDRQTLPDENRTYIASLDGAYLNLAGRCAQYQVESVCRQERNNVWYSLRYSQMQWPIRELVSAGSQR